MEKQICFLHIQVPVGTYARATVEVLSPICYAEPYMISESVGYADKINVWKPLEVYSEEKDKCWCSSLDDVICGSGPMPLLFSPTRDLYFHGPPGGGNVKGNLTIRINYTSEVNYWNKTLPIHYTTDFSGYMTSPGFDGLYGIPVELYVP